MGHRDTPYQIEKHKGGKKLPIKTIISHAESDKVIISNDIIPKCKMDVWMWEKDFPRTAVSLR